MMTGFFPDSYTEIYEESRLAKYGKPGSYEQFRREKYGESYMGHMRHSIAKPYTSKLPASSCILGTVIWIEGHHGNGQPCRTNHPGVPGTPLDYPPDPNAICIAAGWMEIVRSYRQSWVHRRFHGTWINRKLYMPGSQLEVVVGAGVSKG